MKKVLKKIEQYSRILIYGDGEIGRLTRVYLHEQGIEISGFVVSNKPVHDMLMDAPVKCIESIDDLDDTLVLVCVHKKWWGVVADNLYRYGLVYFEIIDDKCQKYMWENVFFEDRYADVEEGRNINTLLYHRIEELDTVYSLIVNKRNFEEQLKYIKANYKLLRCDENWNCVNEKSIAITFDDGYVDFYRNVYPLLRKYEIPATVFVATGNIDGKSMFWWDELECIIMQSFLPERLYVCGKEYHIDANINRITLLYDIHDRIITYNYKDRDSEINALRKQTGYYCNNIEKYRTMSREEIWEISKCSLVTIGAHTVSHILCDKEDPNLVKNEIWQSQTTLESIIDREVKLFAYPNGNVGNYTRDILRELGFERAFTCFRACSRNDENKYEIPRSPVLNWGAEENERRFRGMWQTGKDT